MTCERCEEMRRCDGVAWVRVGAADVGLVGCDEHLNEMLAMARESKVRGPGKVWYRVFPAKPAEHPMVLEEIPKLDLPLVLQPGESREPLSQWKVICGKCGVWGLVRGDRKAAEEVFGAHLDYVATREGVNK